ncbi:hypothetical protein BJV85_002833 [Clostridium acetobutylicum]|uniref:hypothetical protein n=1 Tax=Clostridium acetobutylicum TaxID=1488 RepID=UPI000200A738|nr:hypothetical protein [Clostridium acetobutylicum]ADZ20216.1 Conserved hypothetical protein [Clostridium acetobutylicum EA 2018]NOV89986.1 hypothetical protein [Clostridium acetobutylicum]NOW15486.1 hypothetical protein [Clostridium acetobutylicum]NRY57166.1 hypothetical protein [Clostridium acetobutylicum]NSA93910.1 hypothetical protein [Clostridium acetobutylicum]
MKLLYSLLNGDVERLRKIENKLYRIQYYTRVEIVEAEIKKELFEYLAKQESKGYLISSVVEIDYYTGKTPRIAFKTNNEYKKIKRTLQIK